MTSPAKCVAALPAVGLLLVLVAWAASCDIDGVTPNCSQDASDCVTAPGDAYPTSDAGAE